MSNLPESLYDEEGRPIKHNKLKISLRIKVLGLCLILFITFIGIYYLSTSSTSEINWEIFKILLICIFIVIANYFKFKVFRSEEEKNSDDGSDEESSDEDISEDEEENDEKDLPDNSHLADSDIDRIIDKFK